MLAILGILGYVWISGLVVTCVSIATGVGMSVVQGQKAEEMAKKQAEAQRQADEKKLRLQQRDKALQDIVTKNNLQRQRAQLMSTVAINNLRAKNAEIEANSVARKNDSSEVKSQTYLTSRPTHNMGTPAKT